MVVVYETTRQTRLIINTTIILIGSQCTYIHSHLINVGIKAANIFMQDMHLEWHDFHLLCSTTQMTFMLACAVLILWLAVLTSTHNDLRNFQTCTWCIITCLILSPLFFYPHFSHRILNCSQLHDLAVG